MATMLDAGWTLGRDVCSLCFGVDVKEVRQATVEQMNLERNQDDDQRRGSIHTLPRMPSAIRSKAVARSAKSI